MAKTRLNCIERRRLAGDAAHLQLQDSDVLLLLEFLANEVESPVSERIGAAARQGDIEKIISFHVDPRDYTNPEIYFKDRQLGEFLRKYPFKGRAEITRKAALESFWASERKCQETNRFVMGILNKQDSPAAFLLWKVKHKISQILGDFPSKDWLAACRFGPGSTLSTEGFDRTGLEHKFGIQPTLTGPLLPFLGHVLADIPNWHLALQCQYETAFSLVQGNKVTTVPKNAKTDRTIAVEPHINQYLQLGLGSLIRRRLFRKTGIDLAKGQDQHKELARRGSLDNALSTIDLEAASDTISLELVRYLLPSDWLHALMLVRSPVGQIDGVVHEYQKFSSMGNGATFELETLIFYSIASVISMEAGVEFDPRVYGDDIIVDSTVVTPLTDALKLCGFSINQRKSFSDDCYFRESCGGDYFKGVDVRPIYITKRIDNALALCDLANRIWEVASRRNSHHGCDSIFLPVWKSLHRRLPRSFRRLISTPPGVPGGLWIPGAKLRSSNNMNYEALVLTNVPRHLSILQTGIEFVGPPTRDELRVGYSLMAARLKGVVGGNRAASRGRTKLTVKYVSVPSVHLDLAAW